MAANPQKDEIERVVKIGLGQVRYILRSVQNGDDQREAAGKAIQIVDAAIAAMGRENEVLRAIEAEIADAEAVIERTDNHRVGAVQQGRIEAAEAIRAVLTNTPDKEEDNGMA